MRPGSRDAMTSRWILRPTWQATASRPLARRKASAPKWPNTGLTWRTSPRGHCGIRLGSPWNLENPRWKSSSSATRKGSRPRTRFRTVSGALSSYIATTVCNAGDSHEGPRTGYDDDENKADPESDASGGGRRLGGLRGRTKEFRHMGYG